MDISEHSTAVDELAVPAKIPEVEIITAAATTSNEAAGESAMQPLQHRARSSEIHTGVGLQVLCWGCGMILMVWEGRGIGDAWYKR